MPVTGLVKLPEGEGLVAEDAEPGHDLSAETLRGGDENAQNNLFPPRQNVKAPGLAANAHANAAAAIAEHAAPEALSHSAVTRDDGGLEFDRVASSRLETVSAAANSNIHVNPVRDQIVAAVTARHGEHKLEVRLDPPELGRVTIGFERDGGDIVRAVISANTPDTLDLMRRHADVFQRALEDQGFTGLDLHFADHGPQEGPAGQAGESTQNFRLSEEDAPAAMMTGPAPRAVLGRLDRRL